MSNALGEVSFKYHVTNYFVKLLMRIPIFQNLHGDFCCVYKDTSPEILLPPSTPLFFFQSYS